MFASRIGYARLEDAAQSSIRDGMARLNRAADALSSSGFADAAATVEISDAAKRLSGPRTGLDELDAMLELRRAGLEVRVGVAVLQSADDMAREALAITKRR